MPQISKPVPADTSLWSPASKRSHGYLAHPPVYEDIPYDCWRCGKASIFSAADQKKAFEVRKSYIWQRRLLCSSCWSERKKIESGIAECKSRWSEKKKELKQDVKFLDKWLSLLEAYPAYAGRKNTAAMAMLLRLGAKRPPNQSTTDNSGASPLRV